MVTADGIVQGVPSVVSSAVDWAPESWKAEHDEVHDIAKVGLRLIRSETAIHWGRLALWNNNRKGLQAWKKFLGL